MRILSAVFAATLLAAVTLQAWADGGQPPGQIMLASDIYQQLKADAHLLPKGDFETADEYAKRIVLTRIDKNKEYYVWVMRPKLVTSFGGNLLKMFAYDADTHTLNVYAADFLSDMDEHNASKHTVPICIYSTVSTMPDYIATNAYGATATVHERYVTDYVVDVTNSRELGSAINTKEHRFELSLPMDRDAARRLADDAEVAVGIHIVGIGDHDGAVKHLKPTLDDPTDETDTTNYIDAVVDELVVIDPASKVVISRTTVKHR